MATFRLQTPEGKLFEVEAPDMKSAAEALQTHLSTVSKPFNPVEDSRSFAAGAVRGARDLPDGGAQLMTHGLESLAPEGSWFHRFVSGQRELVDRINREAERDYQQNWRGNPVGRAFGGTVAMAPLAMAMPGAAAEGLGARVASGMASGAATGALQPVGEETQPKDFWNRKLEQAATGGAAGAAAPVAAGAAARVISPNSAPAMKQLMDEGVKMTPGQMAGGWANRLEEGMQSIPIVGDLIKGARTRAVQTFDRAAINRALEPIGESLDKDTAVGRDAIAEARKKVSGAYDDLLPKLQVRADPQFVNNVQTLLGNTTHLEPGLDLQFRAIMRDKMLRNFSPGGGMTGQGFKESEGEIGRLANDYATSSVASERQLGGALKQLQAEMRDLLVRSNPTHADTLKNVNSAYANLLRVEGAASKAGADEGVFTPAHLSQAVRGLDPSMRKGSFARGEALMQDLADAGKTVLGSKVPDSGTPYRAYVGLPAMLAASHYDPSGLSMLPAAAAGAVGAAYTRPGRALAEALLARRPAVAGPVASAVRSPALTPLAAILAQSSPGP